MNAILALASLNHARMNDLEDLNEAVSYYNACLHTFVNILGDPDRIYDDTVSLTGVLLHLYQDLYCEQPISQSNGKEQAD